MFTVVYKHSEVMKLLLNTTKRSSSQESIGVHSGKTCPSTVGECLE